MAAFQMSNYYPHSQLSIDTHSRYFDDDDASILDENILDGSALDSALDMSPPIDGTRRDSYAVSSAPLFSPKADDWQHLDMQTSSNNPFAAQNNNPFMNPNTFTQQPHNAWPLDASAACTPMQAFDSLQAPEFQGNPFRSGPVQTLFSNANHQSLFSPATALDSRPPSPQKDWTVPDTAEHRAMPKRMRPSSPGLRSHSPLMRRDGIRKKNARFDIPAERNLLNIDHLIQQSTDDQEIKELKQQKRLLRNRQAALDSRQRKKQHTERLEDEKKHYTALISDLEEELADMRIALENCTRKEQQYQQYIDNLQMEKEEMIRAHTIETGDLRKKVSVLTDHVQKLESTALSGVPSQTGFNNDYSDIDSLTMDGAWDSISFLHDFPSEPEIKQEPVLKKSESTALITESDKPAAQGLLLMLLLVGAFVASKASAPSIIPRMSDDVRAASATILEDIFTEAGVSASATALAPRPSTSADPWSGLPSAHVNVADLTSTSFPSSALGDYADALSRPTEAQEHEQLFSLSAAQYNAAASPEFMAAPPVTSTSAGRRNLAESLAAMRAGQGKKTDVYTRSLLWDQVPQDVVRRFARLVEECEGGAAASDDPDATLG